HSIAETLAFHERHGEPETLGGFARVEHREDVGMLQPGGELDLALEPFGAHRRSRAGVEHLERHQPMVPEIACQKYRRHPSPTKLTLDQISISEGLGQPHGQDGHGRTLSLALRETSRAWRGVARICGPYRAAADRSRVHG